MKAFMVPTRSYRQLVDSPEPDTLSGLSRARHTLAAWQASVSRAEDQVWRVKQQVAVRGEDVRHMRARLRHLTGLFSEVLDVLQLRGSPDEISEDLARQRQRGTMPPLDAVATALARTSESLADLDRPPSPAISDHPLHQSVANMPEIAASLRDERNSSRYHLSPPTESVTSPSKHRDHSVAGQGVSPESARRLDAILQSMASQLARDIRYLNEVEVDDLDNVHEVPSWRIDGNEEEYRGEFPERDSVGESSRRERTSTSAQSLDNGTADNRTDGAISALEPDAALTTANSSSTRLGHATTAEHRSPPRDATCVANHSPDRHTTTAVQRSPPRDATCVANHSPDRHTTTAEQRSRLGAASGQEPRRWTAKESCSVRAAVASSRDSALKPRDAHIAPPRSSAAETHHATSTAVLSQKRDPRPPPSDEARNPRVPSTRNGTLSASSTLKQLPPSEDSSQLDTTRSGSVTTPTSVDAYRRVWGREMAVSRPSQLEHSPSGGTVGPRISRSAEFGIVVHVRSGHRNQDEREWGSNTAAGGMKKVGSSASLLRHIRRPAPASQPIPRADSDAFPHRRERRLSLTRAGLLQVDDLPVTQYPDQVRGAKMVHFPSDREPPHRRTMDSVDFLRQRSQWLRTAGGVAAPHSNEDVGASRVMV